MKRITDDRHAWLYVLHLVGMTYVIAHPYQYDPNVGIGMIMAVTFITAMDSMVFFNALMLGHIIAVGSVFHYLASHRNIEIVISLLYVIVVTSLLLMNKLDSMSNKDKK